MIHYFIMDKKKVQFKYAHKLRDIIMTFKSNYKINNVSIIQLLILKKIFKKFNYLTKQFDKIYTIQNISFPIKIFLLDNSTTF